ncbi:MAG: RIP metalloprotease RseP [Ruminococcaceae bacterium]|nr:RIP metalloprotease RseP [Oscillospiraceae bacterium]
MTIIYALIIFCLLIFVHELGHFMVAKACGVKVNEFAIGMGPALFSRQKGETKYSVRVFPIGGYCAMEGEDEDSDEPRALNNQPAWQRACILAAGSVMNFITCVILLIIIAFWVGTATTTIDSVAEGSPAEKAGIVSGDEVVRVDGKEIGAWNDLIQAVGYSKEDTAEVTVLRDGKEETLTAELEYDKDAGRNMIGISPVMEHSLGSAITGGVRNTGAMTVMMYQVLKQLFTGEVSVKELSGPVGIVYATSEAAKSGIMYVIYLAALLSLNLAIINMLPFPALDGGRLLFLVIRLFTGKRVSDETEGRIHFIGICLLFALMIYVTFNDVIRFIIPIF